MRARGHYAWRMVRNPVHLFTAVRDRIRYRGRTHRAIVALTTSGGRRCCVATYGRVRAPDPRDPERCRPRAVPSARRPTSARGRAPRSASPTTARSRSSSGTSSSARACRSRSRRSRGAPDVTLARRRRHRRDDPQGRVREARARSASPTACVFVGPQAGSRPVPLGVRHVRAAERVRGERPRRARGARERSARRVARVSGSRPTSSSTARTASSSSATPRRRWSDRAARCDSTTRTSPSGAARARDDGRAATRGARSRSSTSHLAESSRRRRPSGRRRVTAPLRILHAIRSDGFAGVEQFVLRLAIAQAADGHDVAVIGGATGPHAAPASTTAGVAHAPGRAHARGHPAPCAASATASTSSTRT